MSISFLERFFELSLPQPKIEYFINRNNVSDLRLLLQICLNCFLKYNQDVKNLNKLNFYCKVSGKKCFNIQVEFVCQNTCVILTDYTKVNHTKECTNHENHSFIKIYNLIMLKKSLIEEYMFDQNLHKTSPQIILHSIYGQNNGYFFSGLVNFVSEKKRLKKRFDNVINVSIKKKNCLLKKEQQENKKKQVKPKKRSNIILHKKNSSFLQSKPRFQKIKEDQKNQCSVLKVQNFTSEREQNKSKIESYNSIVFIKNSEEEIKLELENFRMNHCQKISQASIFSKEEQPNYFQKGSSIYLPLSKLNEAGSYNFCPQSNRSIPAPHFHDRISVELCISQGFILHANQKGDSQL